MSELLVLCLLNLFSLHTLCIRFCLTDIFSSYCSLGLVPQKYVLEIIGADFYVWVLIDAVNARVKGCIKCKVSYSYPTSKLCL